MEEEIFITQLHINKVRHLENITIDLYKDDEPPYQRKHLILTGKNGSGKTSVIDHLHSWFNNIDNLKGNPLIRVSKSANENILKEIETNWQSFLKNSPIYILLNQKSPLIRLDIPCFFYPVPRSLEMKTPKPELTISLVNETKKHPDLLTNHQFHQHMVDLKIRPILQHKDEEQIDQWFNHVQDVLRDIYKEPQLNLVYDDKIHRFNLQVPNREPFEFNTMADGYGAIFAIVSDLMMKLSEGQPITVYKKQAIVLIDEIDAHLHVELQRRILPFLTKLFPRVQFIVTTHSPFVLSSIDNAVIYDLENKIQVEDLSPFSYDAIVKRFFSQPEYSAEILAELKQYEQLLNLPERTPKQEANLYILEKNFSQIPRGFAPEVVHRYKQLKREANGFRQ